MMSVDFQDTTEMLFDKIRCYLIRLGGGGDQIWGGGGGVEEKVN